MWSEIAPHRRKRTHATHDNIALKDQARTANKGASRCMSEADRGTTQSSHSTVYVSVQSSCHKAFNPYDLHGVLPSLE
jgi:hypothetical protein